MHQCEVKDIRRQIWENATFPRIGFGRVGLRVFDDLQSESLRHFIHVELGRNLDGC